eukprot:947280-Pyramimonas_sp.AAC.1
MEVHGPTDFQLREDLDTARIQVHHHVATIQSTHTTLTSELDGKLRGAEMAFTHRLEAFEGRAPTLEQQTPELRTALAELRVARAQADQMGTPASVYDFASLEAHAAEVEQAADHA